MRPYVRPFKKIVGNELTMTIEIKVIRQYDVLDENKNLIDSIQYLKILNIQSFLHKLQILFPPGCDLFLACPIPVSITKKQACFLFLL